MNQIERFEASTIKLALKLPRVKLRQGEVAHISVTARDIYNFRFNHQGEMTEVACHRIDKHWVFLASADDPTCRSCLKSLDFLMA